MANNPANGFNQPNGDRQNEAIDPATGLPLPESLVSQTRFVGNTGIESTGHPAKDALIEYVQTLVARGVSAPEIINQVVGPNQRLFSRQQMDDIIERLEANRLYPGVNVIPYVSKDNKTIVRVGDRVIHYDAFGQPKLMANGQPRTGTVTERRPYTLNMKPNGEYEYTDQVYVQWDDTPRPHQAAPRRLEVNRRADGSDPVPAVQNADEEGTPPYIETMPVQPKRVVPRPVARRPVAPPPADSQDIANIANVRLLVVPNGPTYSVDRGDEYTQFQDVTDPRNYADIYVIMVSNGGKWLVKRRDGFDVQVLAEFDTRNEAEANAMDLINQNGGPATPAGQAENVAQKGALINANNVGEFNRVVDPSGMGHTILRGANMTRFDKDQGDGIPNAIYVQQLGDGKWHVIQQMPDGNGGYTTRSVAINDDRNLMEAVATNIVAGNTTADAYMKMWGDPNQPNAPANNDSGITPLIERFNANRMPFGFSLVRTDEVRGLGNGGPILLMDAQANDAGLNGIKGRITQDENGNYVVQKWGGNGGFVGREEYPGIMTALEVLSMHALSVRLERDRGNSPESSKPSSSPSSPNGGDGGGVPPTNPPAGGEGGVPDWAVEDLPKGNWRNGEPSGGISDPDAAQYVRTFWDDDQPPTQYEVNRSENGTKFVGIGGDNEGAEAFMRVEKTELGNWKVVDPRNREGIDTDEFPAEYGDRNVAEALAINKMAGRDELNQDILNQPDSNVPPAAQENAPNAQALPNGVTENRSESMTLYNNPDGSLNEIQVVALGGGKAWQVNRNVPGQATEGLSYHGTREDAEREARERIAQENASANNAPAGPASTDSESPTSGKSDSGLRVGENRAPDGMVEDINADGTYSTDFRIGDKTFQRVRTPSSASYYYNGFEIATTEKNSDGTFNVKTIWAKDASDFVVARDEENALLNAQSQIWAATQDGRVSRIDGDQGASATPAQPTQQPVPEFAYPGEVVNGQMNVGGGVGGQNDFRDITPQPQEGAILRQHSPQNIGGDYNPGFYWENPDGTVAEYDFNRDGPRFMRPIPPSWREPDNSGVKYRPGDVFNPNQGPSDGGNPPAGPSGGDGGNGGNGGNGGTPPTNNPPAGPAPTPAQPEAEPVQEPQGKPRVNKVKPGDRYVKHNTRFSGPGENTHWDIYDAKTKKRIASARTKEIADDIVAGIRDFNGKLIDYSTPIPPRKVAQKFPRPKGYKQTAIPQGQGAYLENPNDPDSPVARVEFDRGKNKWVGNVYANKQDAVEQKNPIGQAFEDASQDKVDSHLHEAVQQELDRRNPPAPQANPTDAPSQQTAVNATRNDLGDGVFSVNNGNGEYGIAVRGNDGKWSARVHESPRDAINNTNPISSGTYDTEQEAEDAMRQTIAERQAQRDQANVLQWQSGSDGKQYLGLDGVAGVDAENAPVYGISPSPFGGWAMARWDSKAAKDAGAPPNSIVAQPDEEAAKNDAFNQLNDFLRNLTGQNPPLVNDENPTTPTNRAEQLPPGTTIQDQVDAGLTTPFNPNADLPGSNPPKA
jgi:hypothetical protein